MNRTKEPDKLQMIFDEFATKFDNRLILHDYFSVGNCEYMISTVDLVLEHHGGNFETMIFNENDMAIWDTRYKTKENAIIAHNFFVEKLKKLDNINNVPTLMSKLEDELYETNILKK